MNDPLEFEIAPEADPDEAAALIVAVRAALDEDGAFAPPPAYRSAWRAAGMPAVEAPQRP